MTALRTIGPKPLSGVALADGVFTTARALRVATREWRSAVSCGVACGDGCVAGSMSPGRADMYWEAHRVVGEADGKVKYLQPYGGRSPGEVLWSEQQREDRLRAMGLAVIRWTSDELHSAPAHIVERFWAAANRTRSPD